MTPRIPARPTPVLVGTDDGTYLGDAEQGRRTTVLDGADVHQLDRGPGGDYHAATGSGLFRSAASYEDRDPGVTLRSADGGTTLEAREFPGQDDDYVNAWASVGGRLFAGPVHGRLLVGPGEWKLVEEFDATVRSLAAV